MWKSLKIQRSGVVDIASKHCYNGTRAQARIRPSSTEKHKLKQQNNPRSFVPANKTIGHYLTFIDK